MPLSPRELEILELIAAGRTTKEIAAALGVSASTIEWHISNAMTKLEASSRAEAVATAMRDGLLRLTTDRPSGGPADGAKSRGPRARPERSVLDVLDRVLDKGIVIHGWADASIAGIQILTMEARVVIVSIDTYLRHGFEVGGLPPSSSGPGRADARPADRSNERSALPEAVTSAVEQYLRGLRSG